LPLYLMAFLICQTVHSNSQSRSIVVSKAVDEITLDGQFDEATWQKATRASGFSQNFPSDSLMAKHDTEVYMSYDDQNLYVFVKCLATDDDFIVPSLKRDFDFFGNDNITLLFDTYNDATNALVFGMNPSGARREATISNAGQNPSDFDESWDNKWKGESKVYEDYWTSELAIPFSTLRFTAGSESWRFNCYRFDTQQNEISTWIPIPQGRFVMDLGFMGDLVWEEPLEKAGKNISIIPYVSAGTFRDFETDIETITDNSFEAGLDAKIGVTSGLNLDLTVNPDFSQVEVDEQVTNIGRFELFFPERRQFFLENADLFGRFSVSRVNPFFSRRIGLAIDPETGQAIQNRILYGARLSGKLNDKLRVGVLNSQTASSESKGIPGINYSVVTAEQRISAVSRLAVIGVNKQLTGSVESGINEADYNRVAGVEYRLNTANNTWSGKATYMRSFTENGQGNQNAHFAQFVYNKRRYRLEWAQLLIGSDFQADVGFVPRRDIILVSPEGSVNFFPDNSNVSRITTGFDSRFFFKLGQDDNEFFEDFGLEETGFEPFLDIQFDNASFFGLNANVQSITLIQDFDPTRIQDEEIVLSAGTSYNFANISASYQSDQRKLVTYGLGITGGSFYNGSLFGFQSNLTYQFRPYGSIGMTVDYNRIVLEEPFLPANLWVAGPRLDITFNKQLFFSTFVQYNNQFDNLNINSRLQWRFAPVSDFFIVYTDNYLTDNLSNFERRNRAIVAKLTYWFNL